MRARSCDLLIKIVGSNANAELIIRAMLCVKGTALPCVPFEWMPSIILCHSTIRCTVALVCTKSWATSTTPEYL